MPPVLVLQLVQRGMGQDMAFGPDACLQHIQEHFQLCEGDVIMTGGSDQQLYAWNTCCLAPRLSFSGAYLCSKQSLHFHGMCDHHVNALTSSAGGVPHATPRPKTCPSALCCQPGSLAGVGMLGVQSLTLQQAEYYLAGLQQYSPAL